MTMREEEKKLLDKLYSLRDTEIARLVAQLLTIRYEMHKESLVTNESDVLRGKAQECRSLLKNLKSSGD